MKEKVYRVCTSLRNLGVKYFGNKMPGQIQNFSVCIGNGSTKKKQKKTVEDLAQTFAYHIGNGSSIPQHFAKNNDLVF